MLASRKTRQGVAGVVALAFVLAVTGYALTNAFSAVDDSNAATGNGTVNSLAVANVDYTLTSGDPTTIDAILFDVTGAQLAAGAQVYVQPDASAGWISCAVTPGATNTIACDTSTVNGGGTTPLNVADVDQLEVVAAD